MCLYLRKPFALEKCVIVDDQKSCREKIVGHLSSFFPDIEIVGVFSSNAEFLAFFQNKPQNIDLAFLDVELEDGLIFDALDQLKETNFKIIFTTGFQEYALKAFSYSAADYLLKPITAEELVKSVHKLEKETLSGFYREQISILKSAFSPKPYISNRFYISTQNKLELLTTNDVLWTNAQGGYCEFHMINGKKILASKPMADYISILESNGFIRVHKSFMVNKEFIVSMIKTDDQIEMKNGELIPISRRRKEEVLNLLKG